MRGRQRTTGYLEGRYMQPIESILADYLEAALWSETDDNGDPWDKSYEVGDFSPVAIETATKDIMKFVELVEKANITPEYMNPVGHDFWLTRNGHGVGFWDGDYEEGDKLTELTRNFPSVYIYLGDDGKLHFS